MSATPLGPYELTTRLLDALRQASGVPKYLRETSGENSWSCPRCRTRNGETLLCGNCKQETAPPPVRYRVHRATAASCLPPLLAATRSDDALAEVQRAAHEAAPSLPSAEVLEHLLALTSAGVFSFLLEGATLYERKTATGSARRKKRRLAVAFKDIGLVGLAVLASSVFDDGLMAILPTASERLKRAPLLNVSLLYAWVGSWWADSVQRRLPFHQYVHGTRDSAGAGENVRHIPAGLYEEIGAIVSLGFEEQSRRISAATSGQLGPLGRDELQQAGVRIAKLLGPVRPGSFKRLASAVRKVVVPATAGTGVVLGTKQAQAAPPLISGTKPALAAAFPALLAPVLGLALVLGVVVIQRRESPLVVGVPAVPTVVSPSVASSQALASPSPARNVTEHTAPSAAPEPDAGPLKIPEMETASALLMEAAKWCQPPPGTPKGTEFVVAHAVGSAQTRGVSYFVPATPDTKYRLYGDCLAGRLDALMLLNGWSAPPGAALYKLKLVL